MTNSMTDEPELLFCLQVHVKSFRSGANLHNVQDPPHVAFSFLDYAPQIIHPTVVEEPEKATKFWMYERGKSCILSTSARAMRRSLFHVPLTVMLVGEIRQGSSKQARLYATSCLSLANFVPPRSLEEGLVSTWGQFSGVVDVYTYVNKVGGCLDLSISLVCYGPRHTHPFLDQLLPSSPHYRPGSPLRDPSLARGHVSPRPSAICDVASSPLLKKPTNPGVTAVGDAHSPTLHDHPTEEGGAEGPAAPHLCPTQRVGNVEPFRLWDADLCSSRLPPPPGHVACSLSAALPVEPDDPPPLFFYRPPPAEGEAHLAHVPVDPFYPPSPPRSRSMLSPYREHWRDPGIAKVPLGRSRSASPVRRAGRSRTPGRRR